MPQSPFIPLLKTLLRGDSFPQLALTVFLAVLNVLHIATPQSDTHRMLVGLRDGRLPSGPLLRLLNILSELRGRRILIEDGDLVPDEPLPAHGRAGAADMVCGVALLLQEARCRLCARGRRRTDLIDGYLKSRVGLKFYSNIDKEACRWRRRFAALGVFESAAETQAFVALLLRVPASRVVGAASDKATVAAFRAATTGRAETLAAFLPDGPVRALLCSVFDFSLHSDQEVAMTLEAVRDAASGPVPQAGQLGAFVFTVLPDLLRPGRGDRP